MKQLTVILLLLGLLAVATLVWGLSGSTGGTTADGTETRHGLIRDHLTGVLTNTAV